MHPEVGSVKMQLLVGSVELVCGRPSTSRPGGVRTLNPTMTRGRITMPLYEVAIVHIDEDDRETLVHGPVAVTAMNGERAKLKVFRDFNLRDLDQDELTILSRPFGTGM